MKLNVEELKNVNSAEFQVKHTLDKRKLTIFIALLMLITAGSVWAGVAYLSSQTAPINLGESATISSNMPAIIVANAGDFKEYTTTVSNQANVPLNMTFEYTITSDTVTLQDGDVMVRAKRSDGTIAALSSTVVGNKVVVIAEDMELAVGGSGSNNVTFQFAPNATTGTYNLTAAVKPGQFEFK